MSFGTTTSGVGASEFAVGSSPVHAAITIAAGAESAASASRCRDRTAVDDRR